MRTSIVRDRHHPAADGVEIELVGAIASMVAFANGDSKKAALERGGLC